MWLLLWAVVWLFGWQRAGAGPWSLLTSAWLWLSLPGLQRRRLIPAPLPDAAALGRKPSLPGQWVDLPPLAGALKEPFEIKVYEIDDVQRLQRHRPPPREDPAQVRARGAWGWTLGARVACILGARQASGAWVTLDLAFSSHSPPRMWRR